jgi:hypothetical protein
MNKLTGTFSPKPQKTLFTSMITSKITLNTDPVSIRPLLKQQEKKIRKSRSRRQKNLATETVDISEILGATTCTVKSSETTGKPLLKFYTFYVTIDFADAINR